MANKNFLTTTTQTTYICGNTHVDRAISTAENILNSFTQFAFNPTYNPQSVLPSFTGNTPNQPLILRVGGGKPQQLFSFKKEEIILLPTGKDVQSLVHKKHLSSDLMKFWKAVIFKIFSSFRGLFLCFRFQFVKSKFLYELYYTSLY